MLVLKRKAIAFYKQLIGLNFSGLKLTTQSDCKLDNDGHFLLLDSRKLTNLLIIISGFLLRWILYTYSFNFLQCCIIYIYIHMYKGCLKRYSYGMLPNEVFNIVILAVHTLTSSINIIVLGSHRSKKSLVVDIMWSF